MWGILLSPRSRLRSACRQREVIEVATARAVERRVSYKCNELETIDINRASGYIVNNPTLAPQATMWGPKSAQDNPNRGAVAHPAAMGNSSPVLADAIVVGGRVPWVTLRSPTAKCLASTARRHMLRMTWKVNVPRNNHVWAKHHI